MTIARLVALVALGGLYSAAGKDVKYTELGSVRLPYGEAITITGKFNDLQSALADTMEVESFKVLTKVSGLPETQVDGSITGDSWQVTVGPFPENAVATLSFSFAGAVSEDQAQALVKRVTADASYLQAVANLFTEAFRREGESDEVYNVRRAAAFQSFTTQLAEALRKHLPTGLKLAEGGQDFVDAFLSNLNAELLARFGRLATRATELRRQITRICTSASISPCPNEASKTLGDLLAVAEDNPFASDRLVRRVVDVAKNDFTRVADTFAQEVVSTLDVNLDLSQAATIKDFEKYAGIDVGAIYLPALDELRAFATLNVYFGPIEATPAPSEYIDKSDGKIKRDWTRWLQQRLSLTFGVSTGDISGRSGDDKFNNNMNQATVSGNNAFLYGLGFRINKHIRLSGGGAVFRNSSDNTLNNTLFIGPSIDLTGLKFLRGVVGKNP